jgi:hypothetical protein
MREERGEVKRWMIFGRMELGMLKPKREGRDFPRIFRHIRDYPR